METDEQIDAKLYAKFSPGINTDRGMHVDLFYNCFAVLVASQNEMHYVIMNFHKAQDFVHDVACRMDVELTDRLLQELKANLWYAEYQVESLLTTIRGELCELRFCARQVLCDSLLPGFLESAAVIEDSLEGGRLAIDLSDAAWRKTFGWYNPMARQVIGAAAKDAKADAKDGSSVSEEPSASASTENSVSGLKLAILQCLSTATGRPTAEKILESVGGSDSYLRRILAEMSRDEHVASLNPGYRLTPKGKAALQSSTVV